MAFDPDAYLRQSRVAPASGGFDPDAYLRGATQQPEERQGFLRSAADVPVQLTRGVLGGIRGMAELFGADNETAQALKRADKDLARLLSAQAQNDQEEIGRILEEAKGKGTLEEIKSGIQAFATAPVDITTQALGYAAPSVIGGLAANLAKLGVFGVRATQAAVGAGMGAGMAKGDIYETVKGELLKNNIPEEQAEKAAMDAQAYGGKNMDQILLAAGLGGAAAVGPLENILTRLATRQGLEESAKSLGRRVAEGAAKEALPEAAQAAQQQFSQNLALRREGFDVPLEEGLAQSATMEFLAAAGLGGAAGAATRRAEAPPVKEPPVEPEEPEVPPEVPPETPPEIPPEAPPPVLPEGPTEGPPPAPAEAPPVLAAPEPPVIEIPPPAVPPVAEPVRAEPPPPIQAAPEPVRPEPPKVEAPPTKLTDDEMAALANYETGLPDASGIIFQNRDRSGKGSVDQMQKIASSPDYSRVGTSTMLATGSPVVISDFKLPAEQMGRVDTATASDGKRFPVQYAVVSADTLQPSNFADGSVNPVYQNMAEAAVRPVAGNGRVAGIKAAYTQDTANKYRQELLSDTLHGISPDVISQIPNPVLVRVMPKSLVPPNIGDISNVSGMAGLEPVDRAKNDLNRLAGKFDLTGLQFSEDGSPQLSTLRQFVQAMPESERTELINKETGMPNPEASNRLMNAIFYGAYQSDALIDLYAGTLDPDAKMYLATLARVAPKMIRLEGAGDYDIRRNVVEGVENLVNAVRRGVPIKELKKYAQQGSIDMDPNTQRVMEFIADKGRSSKAIAEGLSGLADRAFEISQMSTEPDMFGEPAPARPSVESVFDVLKVGPEPDLFGEPPVDVEPEPTPPAEPVPEPTPSPEPDTIIPPVKPNFQSEKPDSEVEKEISKFGSDISKLADWAVTSAPNESAKAIAEKVRDRINGFKKEGVSITFKLRKGDKRSKRNVGVAKFKWGASGFVAQLELNAPDFWDRLSGSNYETILHELLHIATVLQIGKANKGSAGIKDLQKLYLAVRKRINEDVAAQSDHPAIRSIRGGSNMGANMDELISWGLTNSDFQDYLTTIKIKNKNGFSYLAEIIKKILGIDKVSNTALEELMRVSQNLLDTPLDELKADLRRAGITQIAGLVDRYGTPVRFRKTPAIDVEEVEVGQEIGEVPPLKFGRKNIFGDPAPNPTWGRLDGSKIDDAVYVLQDKFIDLKRVVENIKKAGKDLSDRWDAYLKEELYHGRTAKRTKDFIDKELAPLLENVRKSGLSMVDLEEYLHNRHAEERNNQVAKVNPNMPDGGSGIMTADARAYLAGLDPQKRRKLEALANQVYDITKRTRQLMVDSGLENQETIDNWEGAYQNYIPLMREEADYQPQTIQKGVGRGMSVRGSSSMRATGSDRSVIDILANIAMQRERTIVRSEKARVSRALYGLVLDNPNPDFFIAVDPFALNNPERTAQQLVDMGLPEDAIQSLMEEPLQTVVDPSTGQVTQRVNPLFRTFDHVVSTRIDGQDKFIFFNPKDPRALRMAAALKNIDAQQAGQALQMVGQITRYFAAVNTQYNPIFGIINFMRDIGGAMLQISTTEIADMRKQVIEDTMPALRGIYAELRARRDNKAAKGEWARLWEEFQSEGGQTGFRDQFNRSEQRTEALEAELKKLSEGKIKTGGRAVFDWLSDYNESMENAVRLAAYKAALDKGLSKERAASLAKNLTVNFNRKGQIGQQAGALYAFFNASVQGTARMYQTLKGPVGKQIMYGGLILGSAQALMLAAAGFDEDEPPDFIKDRNIVIPTWDGKYFTIPMPLGFNIIPTTGRVLTEWAMSGFKDTPERLAHLTGQFLEMFNPIGNAGWSFQTFAPTIADPAVALFENRDWTGKPIAKRDISGLDPTPGYSRAKDTASWFSTQLAYALNMMSGGTDFKPGVLSPTPDQIDYLIGQATGGVGRELLKAEQTVRSTVTGEELPAYKIPLVGRFVGETTGRAPVQDRFYRNVTEMNMHENEIKGLAESRGNVREYLRDNPEAVLYKTAANVERNLTKLRKYRSLLLEKNASREEVKRVEDMITNTMKQFNDLVERTKAQAES
jgi:hypothetical protein